MPIQLSNSNPVTTRIANQFPQPPKLKSFSPADVMKYSEDVAQHLDDMNKVLTRTLNQLATAIDTKANKT